MPTVKLARGADFVDWAKEAKETGIKLPTNEQKAEITAGSLIKIGVKFRAPNGPNTERFWLTVEAREGDKITGRVSNDLVFTPCHGLVDGDLVEINPDHVLIVWNEEVKKKTAQQIAANGGANIGLTCKHQN